MIEGEQTLLSYYKTIYDENSNKRNIPPFIGCFLSDKDGRILLKFEVFPGATKYFLKIGMENQLRKENFDVEIIPMFLSALEGYTDKMNFQNLVDIDLRGSKIGMYVLFLERYNITMFSSPNIEISNYRDKIEQYFQNLINCYESELKKCSNNQFEKIKDTLIDLEEKGNKWIERLNDQLD
jgi:hypothetical protein